VSIAVLAFVLLCVSFDLTTRRIPNLITGAAILGGLFGHLFLSGFIGLCSSFAGFLLLGSVLILPFALGGIGGGDVKMMAGLGALLGPVTGLSAMVIGMVIGGAIMVVHLARCGRLKEKLFATANLLLTALKNGSVAPLDMSSRGGDSVSLPYSVPLGLGALTVILISGLHP